MGNRNLSIDLGRWIFCFLIVTIHLNTIGSNILVPIARCGVPFFYMVTGYFLAQANHKKILAASVKWFKLWLCNSIILAVLVWAIQGKVPDVHLHDCLQLLLLGTADVISKLRVHGYTCDVVSPLWFLYYGAVSLLIISMIRKFVGGGKWPLYLLAAGVLIYPLFAYVLKIDQPSILSLFSLSLSFISIGMLLAKRKNSLRVSLSNCAIIIFLIVATICEANYLKGYRSAKCELFVTSIPLAIVLFRVFESLNLPQRIRAIVGWLPVKSTMDVYVWHCFAAYIILMCGLNFYYLTAIIVFILVSTISVSARKFVHR
jgi:surface polysaccharide O-acyltransferase-like enzyme